MRGETAIVLGTGYSLLKQMDEIRALKAARKVRLFGVNDTFKDFDLDVWIACDEGWHEHRFKTAGPVKGDFDKWHWDGDICRKGKYNYIQGCWSGGSMGAVNQWKTVRPGFGLSLNPSWISLNHGSAPQAINLAVLYGCDPILLVGHDFHYDAPRRHYFETVSDVPGEYPAELRKTSLFHKQGAGDDMEGVYARMAATPGIPRIINVTPGSKLRAFPQMTLAEALSV